jgi:ferrochelatase
MRLGARARLCFPAGWTESLVRPDDRGDDRRAGGRRHPRRRRPIAFTGEHIETLQEIDILYRGRAERVDITHFARARTVGTHPAFIGAPADLAESAARAHGWV